MLNKKNDSDDPCSWRQFVLMYEKAVLTNYIKALHEQVYEMEREEERRAAEAAEKWVLRWVVGLFALNCIAHQLCRPSTVCPLKSNTALALKWGFSFLSFSAEVLRSSLTASSSTLRCVLSACLHCPPVPPSALKNTLTRKPPTPCR